MPCICLIKLNGKTLSMEEGAQAEKVESETGQNRTGKKPRTTAEMVQDTYHLKSCSL